MTPGMDSNNLQQGEIRRSFLIDRELDRLNVDIAALQETRLHGTGSIKEKNYTFFWKGLEENEPRYHGVGIAIRNKLVKDVSTPLGISERLMSFCFDSHRGKIWFICAYAPTLAAPPVEKDEFYDALANMLDEIPETEGLYLLGDFNSRVGANSGLWPSCLGSFGVGNMNENGQRLLELCSFRGLCITNTFFKLKFQHKVSWRHPRSKHWHQIDFIITRRRDLNFCKITRSYHSADCSTDHILVISRIRMEVRPSHRARPGAQPRLNRHDVKNREKSEEFAKQFQERIAQHSSLEDETIDEHWRILRDTIYRSAKDAYGTERISRKDWVVESQDVLIPVLEVKRKAMLEYNKVPTRNHLNNLKRARSEAQRVTRYCSNYYWTKLCQDIQDAYNMGDMKRHYDLLKVALGPNIKKSAPLKSKDGTVLVDKTEQMQRWVEHFSELYARDELTTPHPDLQGSLQMMAPLMHLDELPTMGELETALASLPSNKAPGMDGIPGEILKYCRNTILIPLFDLLSRCWTNGEVPQDMIDAVISTIYKNKGDKGSCDNFRGISLLDVAGKVFAKIIQKRLWILSEGLLPESQCGFRSGRSTVDMMFTLRQLQEKCREQRKPLFIAFIDLHKAFDTVCRPALYKVLESVGCPPRLLKLVASFHDGTAARIRYDGLESEPFEVKNGVKQGCVLAPTLFSIYFAAVLGLAFVDCDEGVYVRTRLDGSLFNLARLRSRRYTSEFLCRDLLFADDAALVAHEEGSLQILLSRLARACTVFSLKININKTEIMTQGTETESHIVLDGEELSAVDSFKYLGSFFSRTCKLDQELAARIGAASTAFGRLTKRVWDNRKLTMKTKMLIYQSCILSSLLYGAETWTLYSGQEKRLNSFNLRNLRKILKIKWQDKVCNDEVLDRAGQQSLGVVLRERRMRWLGHVHRMDDTRIPKLMMYGELSDGSRPIGRPKLRFKDICRLNLKELGIDEGSWSELAEDRAEWRGVLRRGLVTFEDDRRSKELLRRNRRHELALLGGEGQYPCRYCGRLCRANIGRISHERYCILRQN